jgi:hypothetical protein
MKKTRSKKSRDTVPLRRERSYFIGEAEWMGGGGALLAWPTTAANPQITMDIYISDWTHKFQNKTGLDAKAILELYKSNQVNSVVREAAVFITPFPLHPLRPDLPFQPKYHVDEGFSSANSFFDLS